jgi:subtilisin family serine protease
MTTRNFCFLLSFLLVSQIGFSQANGNSDSASFPANWFLLDPETDSVQGLSVEKAYTLLKGKPSRTVIVAVMDTGVDFDHEDLKDVMWRNPKEIASNGLDDDKNGYIDDVYGWNFIGGKNGNVTKDTYEVTREYIRLRGKYETLDPKKVSKKDKAEYDYWLRIRSKYEEDKAENESNNKMCEETMGQYKLYYKNLTEAIALLKTTYKKEKLSKPFIDSLSSTEPNIRFARYMVGLVYKNSDPNTDPEAVAAEIKAGIDQNTEACDHYKTAIEYGYNLEFDPRTVIGDNYLVTDERHYGNNDVKASWPVHGTHVAGIIAANRTNNVGIKGIADNVRIMAIRVVPNGDERDKDIASGIYYAVDNGAHIINMSFGKNFSPQKAAVDKAVQYAEQKGVLIVHGAGNESSNNDSIASFPSRFYVNGKEATNWIEVGASGIGADNSLAADFSNFGKKSVDFFAPGVQIYSTTPGNDYKYFDGTSMASPATAGVAALLMSYFPDLTVMQIRDIMQQSTRKFDKLNVNIPGKDSEIAFNKLSITGGLLNAYEAVKLALTIKGKPVEK